MASAFQYQWNNYLKSGGSKLVELFQDILNDDTTRFSEFNNKIIRLS